MIVINPNPKNINHAIQTLSTAIASELYDLDIFYNTRGEIESVGTTTDKPKTPVAILQSC